MGPEWGRACRQLRPLQVLGDVISVPIANEIFMLSNIEEDKVAAWDELAKLSEFFVADTPMLQLKSLLKALSVFLRGVRTDGDMAPEIPLHNQRPAEFMFEGLVKTMTQKREDEEAQLKAEPRSQSESNAA